MPAPRVFISYSHDSPAHCDAVLALAQQLRRDGIDAELDQFHAEELLHWPRWCAEQMRPENADFVLCVCTAEYARRVEGRVAADVGKGVYWEGTLIHNELYDAKGKPRYVPVLLPGGKAADIPRLLQNFTRFQLASIGLADAGYAALYRLLTRQASRPAEALGTLVDLKPLPDKPRLTDFAAKPRLFKSSGWIVLIMAALLFAGLVFMSDTNPSAEVAGVVLDEQNQPVAGAEVDILETGQTATTGLTGAFQFQLHGPKNQALRLLAKKPGYAADPQYVSAGAKVDLTLRAVR